MPLTEWGVFGVIVALAAFVVSVVTPIIKLNTTIVKLTAIVDDLAKDLNELTNRNSSAHDKINNKLDDHEKRIIVLETKESINE